MSEGSKVPMKTIRSIDSMQKESQRLKKRGLKIGFVPTMGYLHEGHLTLLRAARKKCDIVVVSIYVNPLQFGLPRDFKKYPRDLKRDQKLLKKEKVDYLFIPADSQMYPRGLATGVEPDRELSGVLCGLSRPGHFRGVATVVVKLFNIIQPESAFFGEKDYQQLLIIKRLVEDLNLPVKIIGCPLVREKDGLAYSSRNACLKRSPRKIAPVLYQALLLGKKIIKAGEVSEPAVKMALKNFLSQERKIKIDYLAIVDPQTLKEVRRIEGKVRLVIAAKIGPVRLIDNLLV